MKIATIIILLLALIGVSVWFYMDHTALSTKVQKQADFLKVFMSCSTASEKAFKEKRQYKSVPACVKASSLQ